MSSPKRAKYSVKEEICKENEYLTFLQAINVVQDDMHIMRKKSDEEVLKLERKLEIEKRPLYDKREEAISHIPNFWVTALMNHPDISAMLDDSEEEYLLYLSRIEVQNIGDDSVCAFKIIFHFKENPYFKNTILVKEYSINECSDGKELGKVAPSTILWKDGHDISQKFKERKCFLFWLTSQKFDQNDFDVAQVIKEDLWVNPLPYYLLSDIEQEDNSDEDSSSEDDVLVIEDSDDDKSPADLEDEESDNDSEDSQSSSEITQNEN